MNTLSQEISKRSAWGAFMGMLTAAIGLVMIVYPYATAKITTEFVGWAFIVVGAAQAVFAFASQTVGNFFVKLLLACLYGVAGIALAFNPAQGASTLTAALGMVLMIQAAIEAVFAFELRSLPGWGWFLFDAIVSAALGVMILAEWPSSSHWAIGTLVGAGVLVNGITRTVVSAAIHHEAREIAKATV